MQPTVRHKHADHRVPIELHVDGADEEVEASTELRDRRRVFARDDMVRPKTLRLIELPLARRESCHVAAVCGGELHGHVPQPADADDSDAAARPGVHHDGRENGDATAEQWAGVGEVQLLREWKGPSPVCADMAGEPAAMTDDRCLHLRAKVM